MFLSLAAIIVGLAILMWSADRFVDGAASIAKHLGVSSMIIGITIVGFGTSAPEILISVIAVLEQTPDIAIGNALGSNIANIGLILGITALVMPLPIAKQILNREFPLLLLATAVMSWCLYDGVLDAFDGALLLALLVLMLWYLVKVHQNDPGNDSSANGSSSSDDDEMGFLVASGWILLGLILLVGSSKLLIWGATNVAHSLGISELVIGLTIVALGTSLPELAASIASIKKGEPDLAIGNIIGSNLFNSLAVIGIPAVITSFSINQLAVTRDLPVVVAITLLFYGLSRFSLSNVHSLTRLKGFCLLSAFVIYQLYLYYGVITGNA
ncbi:MAG: calcium/sodium antiporter [Gammaproteobacteria bacterium]|nr:MAG: calcium/sodium antiporter [Gammaproteobacteria bacterium]